VAEDKEARVGVADQQVCDAATQTSEESVAVASIEPTLLAIEVVYARPERAWRVSLRLAPGSTALQAFEASGLRGRVAELASAEPDLGVFAHPVAPDRPLRDGDRVEIYRPLLIDPKDARRKRAAQQ
jgi:putative ubiquitin-RnfH superfamily antitoxin RatB of RatAB toxin-antitoxin module